MDPRRRRRLASGLLAGGTVMWLFGQVGPPGCDAVVAVTYTPPVVFALASLAALGLALSLRSRATVLLAAAAALFGALTSGFEVHAAKPATAATSTAPALRLMTYNVDKWSAGGASAVAKVIRDADVDVVCMQESDSYWWMHGADERPEALEKAMPDYRFFGRGENRIATRLPIVRTRVLSAAPGPGRRPMVEVVLQLGEREVTVITVHFIPTLPTVRVSDDRGEARKADLSGIAEARVAQADRLMAHVSSTQGPVVVCGDLNAPPASEPARRVAAAMRDAWTARGNGFGWTAPDRMPRTRIDYVFVRGLAVLDVRVIDAHASDHRPVTATLAVP
ncbi:MAG: endonuclease/exonuclease/phosphatase family protein [Polyangiaceae bacterium]